jgi:hypothetical protein
MLNVDLAIASAEAGLGYLTGRFLPSSVASVSSRTQRKIDHGLRSVMKPDYACVGGGGKSNAVVS